MHGSKAWKITSESKKLREATYTANVCKFRGGHFLFVFCLVPSVAQLSSASYYFLCFPAAAYVHLDAWLDPYCIVEVDNFWFGLFCPHSNIYVKLCTSRLCIKMSSFLFVRVCAMPRILYLSCEVPFLVWTPDDISGLISVVPWLSREELSKKIAGNNF